MTFERGLPIPHNFPSLRNGPRKPFLVCGTGLSHSIAPSVQDVTKKCPQAEIELGCSVSIHNNNLDTNGYLYDWAEAVYIQLQQRNEQFPKLSIANSLGLLDDPTWRGKINMPLRGTYPRHRVIARFAREEKWHAIWSLNWDCLLEAGLESVGIEEVDVVSTEQPWPTKYVTYVTHEDLPYINQRKTITIYKPHGCVKSLIRAKDELNKGDEKLAKVLGKRFIITRKELSELEGKLNDPQDRLFSCHFCTHLSTNPLLAVGWSVSETYLIQLVKKALPNQPQSNCADELTIVDIKFNGRGHKQLTECYCCDEHKAYVEVSSGSSGFTTDCLFLWLQALYALECLEKYTDFESNYIATLRTRYEEPVLDDFVIDWVDNFLPTWIRLCWREGLVTYYQNGEPIPRSSILIEKQDEHIPWHIEGIKRPDLTAAARLLKAIGKNVKMWNFDKFPGGFWKASKGLLIIPLPVWGKDNHVELSGLKILLKQLDQDFGYVREFAILPVHTDPHVVISDDKKANLKARVANMCPRIQYANLGAYDNIETYSLEDL